MTGLEANVTTRLLYYLQIFQFLTIASICMEKYW